MSDQVQIALVNMPFSYAKYPPIQRGTLSALLKLKRNPRRLPSTKRPIRPPDRRRITREHLREEGALRRVLFPSLLFRYNPKRAEYPRIFKPVFEQIAQESGRPIGYFEELATRIAPQFLTWALTTINWGRYKLVGFTSTFDQNMASLTMAKLIKDLYPEVTIVLAEPTSTAQWV